MQSMCSSPLIPPRMLLTVDEFRDMMMKRDVVLRHMDVYMEHLYWVPSLGFLHPPTFYRQIQVCAPCPPVLSVAITY